MSNFNLTISPAQIEYLLKPNAIIIQAYDIINNSDQDIYLNTEVLPFIPQGNTGSVIYQNVSTNPNISFTLNNSDLILGQPFTLKANSKQQLVLKIKTSSNTTLADSYYTFFVSQVQNQKNFDFPKASGKIGSHILLSITNTENVSTKGSITSFKVTPKIKDVLFSRLQFSGEVKNDSNYFLKTSGQITLTKNDQTLKEIKLQPLNVLANYYRQINCQDLDNCTLKGPFWPGSYNATLSFDQNLNIPSQSISFFIFPISPIIFILFLVGIIFGIKFVKNRLSSKS